MASIAKPLFLVTLSKTGKPAFRIHYRIIDVELRACAIGSNVSIRGL